jgi:hypothetical protein
MNKLPALRRAKLPSPPTSGESIGIKPLKYSLTLKV